jgi:pimeloyl-ACP methyl ester carboxylesterase
VAEDYLRGPTRIQLARKDAAMWQKFHADFVELSSVGLANTLRGVQLRRPTMYELEARLRELRVPTLVIVGEEDTRRSTPAGSWRRRSPTRHSPCYPAPDTP